MRHALIWVAAIAGLLALGTAPAAAAPATADFQVFVTAGTTVEQVVPNGGATAVNSLGFKAGAIVDNNGGDEATARLRFTLPDGLRFGRDAPDPTESCIGTASTAECQTPLTIGTDPSRRSTGWAWDIVADRAGRYVLQAEITQTSGPDPDLSSNTASATVVVTEQTSPATVTASTVKLTPAKPKAGLLVSATVRVTADGTPLRPIGIACAGTIGSAKLKGAGKAGSGTATCAYRTPRSAKGKRLRGTLTFSASGTRVLRRFSAKLG